ncbi:MAG: imelysin family protein [Cyclobacteriaceae bacterium]
MLYRYLSAIVLVTVLTGLLLTSCGDDGGGGTDLGDGSNDTFDRGAMLAHWADNIIIPAYLNYQSSLEGLVASSEAFVGEPSATTLSTLKNSWQQSYLSWQRVSMFEIGKAEQLVLRSFTNIYPTDTTGLLDNISSGTYNLALASKYDEQGFPAIEYLLFAHDENETVEDFAGNNAQGQYLLDLTSRLQSLTNEVVEDWQGGYRETFVADDGSSGTSSVNKMVNDYIFYYEKSLRAGKVGIPAGIFSGSPLPNTVEARYSGDFAKPLFLEALNATQNFFNGTPYSGGSNGPSLRAYLDHLNTIREGEDLGLLIDDQFESARLAAAGLDNSFFAQVESDNSALLALYDELQKNVILLKVDMLQALNINVDFVDADGD